MSNFFDKFRLGSALSTIKSVVTWAHNSTVNYTKEFNPLIRMYYDSDLGSPIENEVEKAFALASYESLKEHVPDWKIARFACRKVGNLIAHLKTRALDKSKLYYQASTGRISTETAYHETAKRLTAGVFSLGKLACRAGHLVGNLTSKISDFVFADYPEVTNTAKKLFDVTAGELIRRARNTIFSKKSEEKVTKFVEKGLKVAVSAAHKIVNAIDTAIDKARPAIKKTTEFVGRIAEKVGDSVKSFTEKVKSAASTVVDTTKEVGKKVWKILTSWL